MSALEITRDTIRRFPFAVKASRITDADQAWIAAEMAARVKAEQKNPGALPGSTGADKMEKRGSISANTQARIDRLVDQMDNGPMTASQIRDKLCLSERVCQNLLRDAQDAGIIKCVGMRGSAKVWGLK